MITIKEFSQLCSCSTQTLRYYDKIGLLKPVKVDPWSGYRYYAPPQAVDFVKIKNLQAADFTIDEIKKLLAASDDEVYEAFQAKIAAQEQKLERIIEIQKSYLSEKMSMEKVVRSMSDFLLGQLGDFETLREFGMEPEDGPRVVEKVRGYLENQMRQDLTYSRQLTLTVNGEVFKGAEQIAEKIRSLTPDNLEDTITLNDNDGPEEDFSPEQYAPVWERYGWAHVYEFIDEIPEMESGREYCFFFRLTDEKFRRKLSYPMFMLGAMILKKGDSRVQMGCSVEHSEDGQNHFSMCRRQ